VKQLLLTFALLGVGLLIAPSPAQACNWGKQVRRIPLGLHKGRLVLLELRILRNFVRKSGPAKGCKGRGSIWWGTAVLRRMTLGGRFVGKDVALGKVKACDQNLARDFGPVVRKALRRAKKLKGFQVARAVRQDQCWGGGGCAHVSLIRTRIGRLKLRRHRRGHPVQAVTLVLPTAFFKGFASSGHYFLGIKRHQVSSRVELGQATLYRVGGWEVVVTNLGAGFGGSRSVPRSLGRCQSIARCVARDHLGDHMAGMDFVVLLRVPSKPKASVTRVGACPAASKARKRRPRRRPPRARHGQLITITGPTGVPRQVWADPGREFLLDPVLAIPVRYRGGRRVTWQRRGRRILVNGRTHAVDLSDVAPAAFARTLRKSGARCVWLRLRHPFGKGVIAALARLRTGCLVLSVQRWWPYGSQELSALKPLAKRLTGLVIQGNTHDWWRVAQLTALRHLVAYDVDVDMLSSLTPLRRLEHLHLDVNLPRSANGGTRLGVSFNSFATLAPLTKLRRLRSLTLRLVRSPWNKTKLDLSPLTKLKLRHLHVGGAPVAGLKPLARMKSLRSLTLEDLSLSDPDTAPLARLTWLVRLGLQQLRITDRGTRPLARLTRLQGLSLTYCDKVTGVTVKRLVRHTALRWLDLTRTGVGDRGLSRLQPRLEWLSLAGVAVSPKGLRTLRRLKGLRGLDLHGVALSKAKLSWLKSLPKLRHLDLSDTGLGDHALPALAGLAKLQGLDLSLTRVGDKGLARLKKLSRLQWLSLRSTPVRGAGLKALCSARQLRHLDLAWTLTGDKALPPVATLGRLRTFDLTGTNLRGPGLARLKAFGALRRLLLAKSRLTSRAATPLSRLRGLVHLDLSGTRLKGAKLAALARLRRLQRLSLARTGVGDGLAAHLARLPRLQWLDLTATRLTDRGLRKLSAARSLRRLDIIRTKTTNAASRKLRKAMKSVFVNDR